MNPEAYLTIHVTPTTWSLSVSKNFMMIVNIAIEVNTEIYIFQNNCCFFFTLKSFLYHIYLTNACNAPHTHTISTLKNLLKFKFKQYV